jgi:hypothetical protein
MRLKREFVRTAFFAVMSVVTFPALAGAQNAADLMRRAISAQADRLSGVRDVTIVQEVMGMELSMYMEKKDVGGTPVLMPVSMSMGGAFNPVPPEAAQADWSNPFQEEWVDRTKLVGTEEVDGHSVYVFLMDDFSGLDLPGMPAGQAAQDFQPKSFRYSLDRDGLFPRKVEMEGEATGQDGTRTPVKMTMFMEDYREVDGYLHPFRTRAITEGVMEAANIDRAEVQAQLEEMKAQLASMPEAQRSMVEGMMKAQMDRLEGMLGGEGGMEMTITVRDLKVNAGPPGGGR